MVAAAAASLFWFGTYLLERPFGRTTHISLLELADTDKPILKRLVMEAPGTFTHSMAVGYLAESAAEAIGADSLVARVTSYYHDIGKINFSDKLFEHHEARLPSDLVKVVIRHPDGEKSDERRDKIQGGVGSL